MLGSAAKTPMQYRNLGKTGLKVSVLSFGSWVSFGYQLGVPEAKAMIKRCFEHGINFFDNAEVYALGESEIIFGQAIKELQSEIYMPRCDLVISTKVYFGSTKDPSLTAKGLSRKHIIEGTKASLERLGLDYVDILFAHRPDPDTPIEETVRAMNWVINQGWAFYWGTSEWSADQIHQAIEIADRLHLIPPAAEQPQYNLFHREKVETEFKKLYDTPHGLGLTTFSPLACGLLSGKYSGGHIPENSRFTIERYKFLADRWLLEDTIAAVDKLVPIAKDLDCSIAQLAIAWCAANQHVSSVITGASRVEQIEENLGALDVLGRLDSKVLQRIQDAFLSSNTTST